ncbi:MAG: ABC transporter permease [Pseudomonadota bacterium]
MPEMWRVFWDGLSAPAQDALVLVILLLPAVLTGFLTLRGYRPWPLIAALLARNRWISLTFMLLVAVSVAITTGLTSQERALREGAARAAEKFDLVVTAPGSDVSMMLASVYLQPADTALLDGETYNWIAGNERVTLAAPIAFGDSYKGAPLVGTTPDFVTHLASGALAEGQNLTSLFDAVAGARVPANVGDVIEPTHGVPESFLAPASDALSHGVGYRITGKLPPTGSPWDRAVLVSVESVWEIHGLANGHGPDWDGTLGPPFDADRFPGTPAILVQADERWANFTLRSELSSERTMAFLPGAVLARLYVLLGDVREMLSLLAFLTQLLVTVGIFVGLTLLTRLLAKRLALLRALGAPARFIFALTWGFAATLIGLGAGVGLGLGLGTAELISAVVTARTDILVEARLGWSELHLVAGFLSITAILALIPAAMTMARPVMDDLRG